MQLRGAAGVAALIVFRDLGDQLEGHRERRPPRIPRDTLHRWQGPKAPLRPLECADTA